MRGEKRGEERGERREERREKRRDERREGRGERKEERAERREERGGRKERGAEREERGEKREEEKEEKGMTPDLRLLSGFARGVSLSLHVRVTCLHSGSWLLSGCLRVQPLLGFEVYGGCFLLLRASGPFFLGDLRNILNPIP